MYNPWLPNMRFQPTASLACARFAAAEARAVMRLIGFQQEGFPISSD